MAALLILGIIVAIIVIASTIFSWVCYKKFSCENSKEFF